MTLVKRLFLGGPWDGQMHEVDEEDAAVVVPYRSKVDSCHPLNTEHSQCFYTARRYYLQPPTFQHGPSQTWRVFVADGTDPDPDHVLGLLYLLNVVPEG